LPSLNLPSTAVLSATWETVSFFWKLSWTTTVAVVPDICALSFFRRSAVAIRFCIFLKVSLSIAGISAVLKRLSLMISFGKLSLTKFDTSWPFWPWPSKTA